MRLLYACALAALAALLPATGAGAQEAAYPEQPINIIVPFPAGQASDVMMRILGEELRVSLGQPVVIENRPGAGGAVGTNAGARAEPDGYTLTLATAAYAITPFTHELAFDPASDFQPVIRFAITPLTLVTNPELPVESLDELVELAKSRPGELIFASSGVGTSHHLAGELFKALVDIDILHVPYAGSAQAHVDLMSGRADLMFDNIVPLMPHLERGTLKALAVTTSERAPSLPDIPTIAEAGLPEFEATAWFGLLAPAETPRPIVDRIHEALVEILEKPEISERLIQMGAQPTHTGPDEFDAFITSEMDRWSTVVERAGVEPGMQ